jgi:hypothetical protein
MLYWLNLQLFFFFLLYHAYKLIHAYMMINLFKQSKKYVVENFNKKIKIILIQSIRDITYQCKELVLSSIQNVH